MTVKLSIGTPVVTLTPVGHCKGPQSSRLFMPPRRSASTLSTSRLSLPSQPKE
jgi:hypothetical protein